MTKTIPFISEIRSTCPCGKSFEVGTIEGQKALLHEMPYCKEFLEKEVHEYLHWVNVMQGRWN